MKKIVVIGAGIGGLSAAYELREKLGKNAAITVVSNSPIFQFVPSNPWVAVNWRDSKEICVEVEAPLRKKNIEFNASGLKKLEPENKRLELGDGSELSYDYLILATGPRLAFEEIPGLGPEGHTQSICLVDHAERAREAWDNFIKNPGPVVIGAAQGASCFGPAYEFAFIVDAALRKLKIRDKVPMTYVSPEPYVGHMGLDGVGDSKTLLESEFRERHIDWIVNAKISDISEGKMAVAECNDSGEAIKQHSLAFDFSMILPPFTGIDPLRDIDGLVNPRGFVVIDKYQRNPKYPEIFAVGVCVAIAPQKPTPVATGVPKTGYMIESMVAATVENIAADIEGKLPEAEATWNAICLADMGDTGIAFVAIPQIPPRNVTWARKGKWVHMAKIAFEKYFMHKIKTGNTAPLYEQQIFKLLGIDKLKN
ncbi:NAD(P)/FAD-dependent oxidoreductase [Halioxenophilus sp. WMMB6]|uniref:NAD(P)/FAD-dependent oxidoreductase n=1 Tax=Halioxenophilus sp. WMMB6 TaxID=3073815 RepID=UPI00295EFFEE|nr:FAD-dependent oxidoreductase [Halioxenophilus sp. WMMB6]